MNAIDSLQFESKKRKFSDATTSDSSKDLIHADEIAGPLCSMNDTVEGKCLGGQVIVRDVEQAKILYQAGDYGSFIGNRQNFVNQNCFPLVLTTTDGTESLEEQTKQWLWETKSQDSLFLSLNEALYLLEAGVITAKSDRRITFSVKNFVSASAFYDYISREVLTAERELWDFVKSYCTYRYFRRRGWIVRDGILFGANFLLYKEGVKQFHASAAVRIFDEGDQRFHAGKFFGALQRELFTCKKTLFLAHFTSHTGADSLYHFEVAILNASDPQISLCNTWNPNRKRLTDLNNPYDN